MADPVADNADFAVDELKRKARRRLVGAIVIALAAATILPLVLEQEQKPLGGDVSVQIPAVDDGKFVNRLDKGKDAPAGAKADGGAIKAPGAGAAAPAAASTVNSGIAAPTTVSAPTPADGGSRHAPDVAPAAASDAGGMAPEAKAEAKPAIKAASKAETRASPGADVASKAHEVKAEPKVAVATPAPATPSGPPPSPPPTDVAVAAPAPAPESPVVPATSASTPAGDASKAEGYVVQMGAFTDNYGANALASKLKKAGYPAFTEPVETSRGTLYRVRVGGYSTRPAAVDARNRLKADGHNGVITAAK